MRDEEACRLFFPDNHELELLFSDPGYERSHKEFGKTVVTLNLLWEECQETCQSGKAAPKTAPGCLEKGS